MTYSDSTSCCSAGYPVAFYWHACHTQGQHLDQAVDALTEIVYRPANRLANPFQRAALRGEFRAVLEAAQAGELVPVDEVKLIQSPSFGTLYELRWNDLRVTETDGNGHRRYCDVMVRLIESEDPHSRPFTAVGLHVFEKQLGSSEYETRELQNNEIATAEKIFRKGTAERWDIPELS